MATGLNKNFAIFWTFADNCRRISTKNNLIIQYIYLPEEVYTVRFEVTEKLIKIITIIVWMNID